MMQALSLRSARRKVADACQERLRWGSGASFCRQFAWAMVLVCPRVLPGISQV